MTKTTTAGTMSIIECMHERKFDVINHRDGFVSLGIYRPGNLKIEPQYQVLTCSQEQLQEIANAIQEVLDN